MSDPLDEAIARRMRSEVPLQAESSAALGELRGPMLRARRRRAAAVNAGRAAVALLVVSAGVFGVASLDDSEPGVVAAGSTTLRSGMQIRLGIESSNVPAGTPLTIRTLDRSGTHEADVIELATEGDSTTTDFALAPVSPGATIAFEAAVLEGQLRIASEALRVS